MPAGVRQQTIDHSHPGSPSAPNVVHAPGDRLRGAELQPNSRVDRGGDSIWMDLDVGQVEDRAGRRGRPEPVDGHEVVWPDQLRAMHRVLEAGASPVLWHEELDDVARCPIETVELRRGVVAGAGRMPEREDAGHHALLPSVSRTDQSPDPRRDTLEHTIGDPAGDPMPGDMLAIELAPVDHAMVLGQEPRHLTPLVHPRLKAVSCPNRKPTPFCSSNCSTGSAV